MRACVRVCVVCVCVYMLCMHSYCLLGDFLWLRFCLLQCFFVFVFSRVLFDQRSEFNSS